MSDTVELRGYVTPQQPVLCCGDPIADGQECHAKSISGTAILLAGLKVWTMLDYEW